MEQLADGSGRRLAEVIRDAGGRVDLGADVGRSEVRIDLCLCCHYDFNTELEDLLTSVLCSALITVRPKN